MRRSWLTGEFHLTLIYLTMAFISFFYAMNKGADLMGVAAVLGAISGPTVMQVYGRNRVKERHGKDCEKDE